jgi:hypothetical protein
MKSLIRAFVDVTKMIDVTNESINEGICGCNQND